jgi:hypothetical protein
MHGMVTRSSEIKCYFGSHSWPMKLSQLAQAARTGAGTSTIPCGSIGYGGRAKQSREKKAQE